VLLERIQRRFTRMIPGLKNLKYEDRLRELYLRTLEDRRVRADLIEVFQIVRGLSSIKPVTFIVFDNKDITRGHQWKLKKKRCNTWSPQHFFSERVVKMWKNLDKHTVSVTSVNCFKNNRLQKMSRHLSVFDESTLVAEPVPPGFTTSGKLSGKLSYLLVMLVA